MKTTICYLFAFPYNAFMLQNSNMKFWLKQKASAIKEDGLLILNLLNRWDLLTFLPMEWVSPVRNAKSAINITSKGKYYVWVRTKNWAAGEWEAPGRFHILINGEELETTLGAAEERWTWQYAGKTSIKDTAVFIELKDLTGFEGRCDAIYLSSIK